MNELTNDNTRLIARKCVYRFITDVLGHKPRYLNEFRDIIHNEINKALNVKEEKWRKKR